MSLKLDAIRQGEVITTEDGYDKHIHCDGSREHVLHYTNKGIHCSHKNCVVNRDNQANVMDWIFINKCRSQNQNVKRVHSLHKYLRGIRMQHGELLKDMADRLGIGSAELSAIENGRKPMPDGFMNKIKTLYKTDS